MNSERWQQIETLFHDASELAPDARGPFLESACAGDAELRNQVEALLQSLEESGDFIEAPPVAQTVSSPTASFIGRAIGHYKVVSLLGAGGMGEVYLARDSKLDRPIALKILPAQFTADPMQVQRFAREARAASALNHPNIITIHEIGHDAGAHFIATEFIAGETLREKINRGKIELKEALRIATQIADALSAAHAAGIVHRDIKPENVMVRPDGLVKVLDFGLAKPAERQLEGETGGQGDGETGGRGDRKTAHVETGRYGEEETRRFEEAETREYGEQEMERRFSTNSHLSLSPRPPVSQSPRPSLSFFPSLPQLTEPGILMGTIAYLSPEQVRREELDPATDVFSFGVVLYEVVTGVRPFPGTNAAQVCDAILSHSPQPVAKLRPEASSALTRIIERALAKDRAMRYRNASEMHADLKRVSRTLETGALTAIGAPADREAKPWRDWRLVALTALVGLAVAAGLVYKFFLAGNSSARSPWAAARTIQLTRQPGEDLFPNLAPDGQSFLYVSSAAGNRDIYRQAIGEQTARNLTQDSAANDTHPAFSPDGKTIAFRSDRAGGGIFLMDVKGENVRQLTDFGFHPAWSPDGRELFCTMESIVTPGDRSLAQHKLWGIDVVTGDRRMISTEDVAQPQWSPNGNRLAYWGSSPNTQRDIWTMAAGGAPVAVTNDGALDWNPVWSPDGRYLYFSSDRAGQMRLWRVAIDEVSGKVLSAVEPVPAPAAFSQQSPGFSRDGRRLIYVAKARTKKNIQRLDFDPVAGVVIGSPVRITRDDEWITEPHLSPDGQWLVCGSSDEPQEDLFILRSDGSGQRRKLTNDPAKDREPNWSPDGKQIAFHSNQSGAWEIWMINADGSNRRQITFTAQENAFVPFWSPDGTRLAYTTRRGLPFILDLARPWWEQTPQAIVSPGAQETFLPAAWSPDGRQLAGPWQPRGLRSRLGAYSFQTRSFTPLTNGRGLFPVWLNDNRRVLYVEAGKLLLSDPVTQQEREVFSLLPHRISSVAVTRDNRGLYISVEENEADIWLLDRQ